MRQRIDRSFAFDVPDTTAADVRSRVAAGPDWDLPRGFRMSLDGDRLRVAIQTSGQFATRVMWVGTMADRAGGVRLTGRIHDGASRVVNGCLAGAALFALAMVLVVVLDDGGAGAVVGTTVLTVVLVALWRWYAGQVRRGVEHHKADTVRMLDQLLGRDPRW